MQAVARDAAVGRLEPDDAAQRGRLTDRAAGVGAERERRQPAATAAADPPLEPPGMRSSAHGLRIGPNAEFSVDEPIANSSQLVLPTMTAPARFEPRDDRRVVRRHVVLEHARRGGGPDAARAQVVLERDRHAGERRIAPAIRGRGRSPAARASARSAMTVLKAFSCGLSVSMRASASAADVGRAERRARRGRRRAPRRIAIVIR